jgi:hypothetical protein
MKHSVHFMELICCALEVSTIVWVNGPGFSPTGGESS